MRGYQADLTAEDTEEYAEERTIFLWGLCENLCDLCGKALLYLNHYRNFHDANQINTSRIARLAFGAD
jgi:hypothetical protein